MDYFELAQASSIRMCVELEKKFSDFRGRQLELMMYLCLIAYNSEIYDGVCDDAWLRTTITFKKDHLHQPHVFSESESPEIRRMAELIKNGAALSQSSWRELQATLTSRIEIRCNILPRRAYWERLQDVQRQVNWIRMQSSMLWRRPCCVSRRGFFPITLVNHARENGSSLKEKVNEWRGNRGSCDLAAHLQPSVVLPTARMASLRTIEPNDVVSMESLGVGGAATVYKVSWRTGIYAMKSFKHSFREDPGVNVTFKERDMASRVLHPHIIHGFGYFEVDGKWRLLMEMLDTNLTRYAVERARVGVKPLFSHADTFDVLLQLASAMEHLHRNGVVHGDLKPDNILLDDFELLGTGRHFLAKVTDLGDAQFIVPGRAFRPAGDGTTKFAAPELLVWRTNRDGVRLAHPQKIDVYSFGGVAHEVLTGYPVYHGRNEFNRVFKRDVVIGNLKPSGSELWRNLRLEGRFPDELIKLVEKCWEQRPEERPSFSEIREELTRCKSIVQSWEDKAAVERRAAEERAANFRKFFALVSLIAFIWTSSFITEKSAVEPFKFIALTLSTFIIMSYLYSLFLFIIRCVISKFTHATHAHPFLQSQRAIQSVGGDAFMDLDFPIQSVGGDALRKVVFPEKVKYMYVDHNLFHELWNRCVNT